MRRITWIRAMATALNTTNKKENFQRLARLLMCGGVTLLREVFDAIHPPASLSVKLNDPATKTQLKGAKLTKPEWNCVYPSAGMCGKSTDFDITLLFRLLRTICYLTPPTNGWDKLPNPKDYTREADLARIKYYRNSVYGHNHTMEITDTEFANLWREISEALLRIAGTISPEKRDEWKESIKKLQHDPLTPDGERYVAELQSWYKKDMDMKDEFEKLRIQVEQMRIDINIMVKSFKAGGTPITPQIQEANLRLSASESVHIPISPEQPQTEGALTTTSSQELQHFQTNIDIWRVILSFKSSFSLLIEYLRKKLGVDVQSCRPGSLVITVSCSSLEILEGLWEDYYSDHLNEMVQEALVTAQVLKKLRLGEVKLKTLISVKEYKAYKELLAQKSGVRPGYHPGTDDVYNMTALPRGITLIINNKMFADNPLHGKQPTHHGSGKDVHKVEELFSALGFAVHTKKNLTKQQFIHELDSVACQDHSQYDCFVLCLMSSGQNDKIMCSDGVWAPIQAVQDLLSCSPTLRGKPKLFFINADRGDQEDEYSEEAVIMEDVTCPIQPTLPHHSLHGETNLMTTVTHVQPTPSHADREKPPITGLHSQADFLIAYSTVDNYVSYRNTVHGSYYINALVEAFREHAVHDHLLDILTVVNKKLSERKLKFRPGNFRNQIPEVQHTLRKKVHF